MNAKRLIRNLMLASGAMLWACTAAAQDAPFTFQVPVDLRDMHPDVRGEISCQVTDAQGTPIAGGTVPFSIDRKTRAFSATVPVSARMASGRSPGDARNYRCVLQLIDGESQRHAEAGSPTAQGNPKFEPAPGQPFTPVVSGPIPSSGSPKPTKPRP